MSTMEELKATIRLEESINDPEPSSEYDECWSHYDVNERFREVYIQHMKEHGPILPLTIDQILREDMRRAHCRIRREVIAEERREESRRRSRENYVPAADRPKSRYMKQCKGCGQMFERPRQRGRPPLKCEECRNG